MVLKLFVMLLAVSPATAATATDQAGRPLVLRLEVGAQAVLTTNERGQVHLLGDKAEPLTSQELALVRQLVQEHPDAFGPNAAPIHSDQVFPAIPQNSIRFRFVPIERGTQALLVIENGSSESYMYKARIGYAGKAGPTDVCQLIPDKRSIEHWAYPLDWIEISEVRAVPYAENSPPRCE